MATAIEQVTKPGDDIDRLALRISLADIDEQFEKIIQKSLVFILKYLSKYADHRKKLMELLGDVTRRLRCRANIQVPVNELFLSYNDPSNSVFLINFSHMYIRLGFPRLPLTEKIKLLPVLFASLSEDKPICQRDGFLHLIVPVIENLSTELTPRDLCLNDLPYQRRYISDFFSLLMLLPYKYVHNESVDLATPDGFNAYDFGRVLHERYTCITTPEDLEKFKVGIVTFYTQHFFPAEESILPILFGYGDSRHSVVSVAAKELRSLSILVDWEDELLLSRILAWYLGRRREFDPVGRNEPRRPLNANMRIKLGHYLMRSRITFPGSLAPSLVEAAMLALDPSNVLQSNSSMNSMQNQTLVSGATEVNVPFEASANANKALIEDSITNNNFVINAPRCSSSATSVIQQRRLAEHGLDLLAHFINNVTTLNNSASVAALRCLINFVHERSTDELTFVRARGFEILSRFLARDPNYLLKDPAQLPRLFDVLSEDNTADLKLAAAHCLRRLAVTLHESQKQNYPNLRGHLGKLERLLYENIEKSDPLSRLVAVNFAGLIYPSDHIPTRYLILQALGDKDPRVRAEACMAFEQFLSPNIIHDIVYGRVKLPSFVEFVNHDTQHSRKNPFVEVERLIPVVQFIRLCLLAHRGALTPAQEVGLTYETEDEVRYLINQTVRYFLSAKSPTSAMQTAPNTSPSAPTNAISTGASPNLSQTIYPEQAKRSIDTYFRLIQVVIFTRSQHTKDSPDFPNYLEEVLVGNTKELITCNKQLFDRMNSVLLATPKGASCRHACASVYSVVVMETETPTQALQTAKGMLAALPKPGTMIDGESLHSVQGMFMGAAYLLERLFTTHVTQANALQCVASSVKKNKKEKQQQKQFQSDLVQTIEELISLMDPFLVKPHFLLDKIKSNGTKTYQQSSAFCYINSSVAQTTVTALLEALVVLARASCLSHLQAGSFPLSNPNSSILLESKATLVHRIAAYLPNSIMAGLNEDRAGHCARLQRVAQASLRALSALCMGEASAKDSNGSKKPESGIYHPHTIAILKLITDTAELTDSNLHLAVGTALADSLLGSHSPYKYHWYERTYPINIPQDALDTVIQGPAGQWLSEKLGSLLAHRPGQVQTRPVTISAVLWVLNLVRRFGPLPESLLSTKLLINLLDEKDESVQCVAVATLGLIYDRSNEEDRSELVINLTQSITSDDKRQTSLVYRELCSLAQQIGRPDLALSLIVLAIALPPTSRLDSGTAASQKNSSFSSAAHNLVSSVTYSSLVRRLGRLLTPVLPRLVPRIFVRRFDQARPKLRQAMEHVWHGLVLYASNSGTSHVVSSCANSSSAHLMFNGTATSTDQAKASGGAVTKDANQNILNSSLSPNSMHAMASDIIEAHFNAIIFEIKSQLGFNTTSVAPASTPAVTSSPPANGLQSNPANSNPVSTTGTQNSRLRDACCLAIASLTTHPSAEKRLAGHLPALLAGLLSLCDEIDDAESDGSEHADKSNPVEEAAVAVQKLVIRVLENPCSREASSGLLPGLIPVIIDREPWLCPSDTNLATSGYQNAAQPQSESRRLALELLLAAARTARPSALKSVLAQLILAGLHTMWSIHPFLISNLMRQPLHHLQMYSATNQSPESGPLPMASSINNQLPVLSARSASTSCKEVQMAEVLRLCIRLIDDVCLSRLIVPFTELIRTGGGSACANIGSNSATGGSRGTGASGSASIATAVCVFLNQLAAFNANAIAVSNKAGNATCTRCAASGQMNELKTAESGISCCTNKPYNAPSLSCALSQSPPAITSTHSMSPPPPAAPAAPPTDDSCNQQPYQPNESTLQASRNRAIAHSQKHTTMSSSAVNGLATSLASASPSAAGGGFAALAPHTGKLLAALLSAMPGACCHPNSAGKTVQLEMARTLASLLRFAKDTSVTKLFNRVRTWYLHPEQLTTGLDGGASSSSCISISHWACARVLHAVAHHCPDLLYAHAGLTLPLIFINKQPDSDLIRLLSSKSANPSSSVHAFLSNAALAHAPIRERVCVQTLNTVSAELVQSENGSMVQSAKPDLEAYSYVWQESWNELISCVPTTTASTPTAASPTSSMLFWPNALALSLKSILPLANGLIDSFLRRPLLDYCVHLLYDALLDSPNWFVRNQAACCLFQLTARLSGLTRRRSTTERRKVGSGQVAADSDAAMDQDILDHCTNDLSEDDEENDEYIGHAWLILVQLVANTLDKCKSWPGKIYLLRAAYMLSHYALDQYHLVNDEANQEIINQMWLILLHETKRRTNETSGYGYQIQAYLTLAAFAETIGRNAFDVDQPKLDESNDSDVVDHLTVLFQMIVPQWTKVGKPQTNGAKSAEQLKLNNILSDSEQELAVLTVGYLWPIAGVTSEHVQRFPEIISFLNIVISQGGKQLQVACMSALLAILAKMSPEQSAEIIEFTKTSKPAVELKFKELLLKIKRLAENSKFQSGRENALSVVAGLLKHPGFSTYTRELLCQILRSYSNESVSSLHNWSVELLKLPILDCANVP